MGEFDCCLQGYPGKTKQDFQCDKQYGGCERIEDCDRMPQELQAGCRWRFETIGDNPKLKFRRVKCPEKLIAKSEFRSNDDSSHPEFKINIDNDSQLILM